MVNEGSICSEFSGSCYNYLVHFRGLENIWRFSGSAGRQAIVIKQDVYNRAYSALNRGFSIMNV